MAQQFVEANVEPIAEYFQPRPSVFDYGSRTSGDSYLAPESEDLVSMVQECRREVSALKGTDVDSVPADAVTASRSGIDPDVSLAYANLQTTQVTAARDTEVDEPVGLQVSRAVVRELCSVNLPE